MLCPEVFAPQRRLHALHGVNTPLNMPLLRTTSTRITLGDRSLVNEDTGCEPGVAAVTISGQQADAADAIAEADVARTGGSTNSTISLERAASRARPVAQSLVSDAPHEHIVFCNHPPSRLRALIPVYSPQL